MDDGIGGASAGRLALRWLQVIGVVVLLALPRGVHAGGSFLIEAVQVKKLQRASQEIVISESQIVAGRTYTEQQLREAAYRVKRLPFVIDVSVYLHRGSERGQYVLVIEVEETERWFFGLDLAGRQFSDAPLSDGEQEDENSIQVGLRQFFGSHGVAYAAVGSMGDTSWGDPVHLELGYTHYNLFGRGGALTLAARSDTSRHVTRFSLQAGVPVYGSHAFRLWSWRTREDDTYRVSVTVGSPEMVRRDVRDWAVGLGWIYDTRDDPVFPERGLRIEGGFELRNHRYDRGVDPRLGARIRIFEERISLYGDGVHYVRVSPSEVVAVGASATVFAEDGRKFRRTEPLPVHPELVEFDDRGITVAARVGFLKTVWRPQNSAALHDMRWETDLRVGRSWRDMQPPTRFSEGDGATSWSLSTSLVLRNRWGLFRFGLSYVDDPFEDLRAP